MYIIRINQSIISQIYTAQIRQGRKRTWDSKFWKGTCVLFLFENIQWNVRWTHFRYPTGQLVCTLCYL